MSSFAPKIITNNFSVNNFGFGIFCANKKMSANIRDMKEMARQESLEAKMKHILADITSIDERLSRLNRQREKLMCRYDELKETKLLMDAKAVNTKEYTEEWEQGNDENTEEWGNKGS